MRVTSLSNKKYHSITLFFDYYIRVLNAGGSFSLKELYDLYITQESKVQLLLDLESIVSEFSGEDWEINSEVQYLYNNFGKNHVKKIVNKLVRIIEND